MTLNQNKTIKTQNEDNIEKQNEKTNTKRQVNKHSKYYPKKKTTTKNTT